MDYYYAEFHFTFFSIFIFIKKNKINCKIQRTNYIRKGFVLKDASFFFFNSSRPVAFCLP